MPVYEYECGDHGTFEALRSMAQSAAPTPCPGCGTLAKRILSAPRLSGMSAANYQAHERNEKSRHEPTLVDRSREHGHSGHHHAHGHGHAHTDNGRAKTRARRYTGARPWVMEHG